MGPKKVMSHDTTEEKCGMNFSPLSGKAMSVKNNFSMSQEWPATTAHW